MSLLTELKQRQIWRVMLAYPGVVFVWLQVVEFFINNYDLDHRFLTASIIAAFMLLPAAVIWNWRHGREGRQRFTLAENGSYGLFGAAAIAAVGWYWNATPVEPIHISPEVDGTRSVVVMPFKNAGDDAEVQYLCDGIAESLTNWLATVPNVKVISKSAAFRLRDDADDTAKLVDVLGVDNIVRGKLTKHGDEFVVSVALVDASDDSQLWGERMVQPLAGILKMERTIVTAIKGGLRLTVNEAAAAHLTTSGTDDPEAYRRYLRGHFLIQATDPDSIDLGLEDLRAAISIDPQFALPYADISAAVVQKVLYGMSVDESLRGEARTAAFTAVALAPDVAESHVALATIHQTITFDWNAAEEAFETAISLSPRSPTPYNHYSEFLWGTLRFERSLEIARRGLEIDPLSGGLMHSIGIAFMYSGNFAEAANALGEWNRLYPGGQWSYVKHALALALDGQCDKAAIPAAAAERMLQGIGSPLIHSWLAWGYQVCDRDDLYAISKSRLAEFQEANPHSFDLGLIFYRILEGDVEGAINLTQMTIAARSPSTGFAQIFLLDHLKWPVGSALQQDPRMRELIQDLDFPRTKWSVN